MRNESDVQTPPLAVHIDITDPRAGGSTDPEDWTATLTQSVGELGPGEGRVARWSIEPISDGNFVLYAVVLEAAEPLGGAITASNVVAIEVSERRSLNPQNVLPVVIIVPALLGVAIVFQRRRAAQGDRIDLDESS